MTKEEILKYIWEEVDGYDLTWNSHCEALAEQLLRDGWCRQKEAEWIPTLTTDPRYGIPAIIGFTCSNCQTKQEVYTNYCSFCGAKMVLKRR